MTRATSIVKNNEYWWEKEFVNLQTCQDKNYIKYVCIMHVHLHMYGTTQVWAQERHQHGYWGFAWIPEPHPVRAPQCDPGFSGRLWCQAAWKRAALAGAEGPGMLFTFLFASFKVEWNCWWMIFAYQAIRIFLSSNDPCSRVYSKFRKAGLDLFKAYTRCAS